MELDFIACMKIHLFLNWVYSNKPDTNNFYSNTKHAYEPYYRLMCDMSCFNENTVKVIIPFNLAIDIASVKRKYWNDYQKHQNIENNDLKFKNEMLFSTTKTLSSNY